MVKAEEEYRYRDRTGIVHLCAVRRRDGTIIGQLWPVCRTSFPWRSDNLQVLGMDPTEEEVSCLVCLTHG